MAPRSCICLVLVLLQRHQLDVPNSQVFADVEETVVVHDGRRLRALCAVLEVIQGKGAPGGRASFCSCGAVQSTFPRIFDVPCTFCGSHMDQFDHLVQDVAPNWNSDLLALY